MEPSLEPNRGTAGTGRRVWRLVIIVPFFLLALGIWTDLWSGLPLARQARSALAWLTGSLGLGALYLVGEMGAEWIGGRDQVTDPLWQRGLRLLALLLFAGAVVGALILVLRAAS